MYKILKISLVLILFSACSSVKLTDSWKSENFKVKNDIKILVAAKSPDIDVRKSYETAIVNELSKKGVSAIQMHKLFPEFKGIEQPSEEEIKEIIELFKEKKISNIIVTSLKSTTTQKSTNLLNENIYIPSENLGKYFFSFSVASSPHALPKLPALESSDSPVLQLESTTYILEAVSYDLLLESKNKLTGVFLVDVIDPKSGRKVLNKFSKIIVQQFEK